MPQATHKFDANKMRKLMEQETEYISNLFTIFDVPDSIEGNILAFPSQRDCCFTSIFFFV